VIECLLRRGEVCLAMRYRPAGEAKSMSAYSQIASGATPAPRSLSASKHGSDSLRSACSRVMGSSAT
jgi:hypothetical protein